MTLQHITSPRGNGPRRAFTLIELLVVISVISILMGLLLVGIAGVRAHSRVVIAKTETQQLAAAWKQYYAEYNRWPGFVAGSTYIAIAPDAAVTDGDALMVLKGVQCPNNPRRMPFAQFNRVNADGTPISPWANTTVTDALTTPESFYYVMFDTDYDNRFQPLAAGSPLAWNNPVTNTVTESVIVWTVNQDAGPGEEVYIIGSWME